MISKQQLTFLQNQFDAIAHQDEQTPVEFWYARELQPLLDYKEWRNFMTAVERAIDSCQTAGFQILDHFVEVNKMITLGKGGQREIQDIKLTRYACYLIAQNGDPKKEAIAFAQCYFALQTRRQELIQDRMLLLDRLEQRERLKASEKQLSQNIYERGVDEAGFGRIRAKGDQALFGGNTTSQMKEKLSMPSSRPLADFLPSVTIAAKNLAAEMTNHNVEAHDLVGENNITLEHIQNNRSVRSILGERGIKPEELPPAEDIKKLERRVLSEEKRIEQASRLSTENKKRSQKRKSSKTNLPEELL